MLGGTEENSVSRLGVIDLPSRQINDFLQRGKKLSWRGQRPVQNDVKVESGDVVSYDDVRVQLADLGQKEPQEGPLRVHLVHLGDRRLLGHDLLKVERPHLVRGSGHGAEVGGE